jgi:polar amino acid transport system permease protein
MFKLEAVLPDIPFLLVGVPLTLAITAASFALGTALALPMALTHIARLPILRQLVIAWIEFFRTTPPLVHVFWPYYILPQVFGIRLSALTVIILALAANASAKMAEIFLSGIQAISHDQRDAATVLGLSAAQCLWYVVLPQTLRLILAPSTSTLVSLLKDSSLAAILAVPELMNRGQLLSTETFRPLEVLTLVAFLYFALTYPLALAAVALERRSRVAFRSL